MSNELKAACSVPAGARGVRPGPPHRRPAPATSPPRTSTWVGRATRPTSTPPCAGNSACKPGNGRDNPRALRCSHSQLLNVIRSQAGRAALSPIRARGGERLDNAGSRSGFPVLYRQVGRPALWERRHVRGGRDVCGELENADAVTTGGARSARGANCRGRGAMCHRVTLQVCDWDISCQAAAAPTAVFSCWAPAPVGSTALARARRAKMAETEPRTDTPTDTSKAGRNPLSNRSGRSL